MWLSKYVGNLWLSLYRVPVAVSVHRGAVVLTIYVISWLSLCIWVQLLTLNREMWLSLYWCSLDVTIGADAKRKFPRHG